MSTKEFEDVLACPKCGGHINFSGRHWSCLSCNQHWPVNEYGVARFTDRNVFFGADQNGMRSLIGEMQKMSAHEFFSDIKRLEEIYQDFEYSYCLDPTRADWAILGNFQHKVIADLGCGYGTLSIPLASHAQRVISVDACEERLNFLSLIASFREVKNICPIHADILNLPLNRDKVDAIILFGVLEYAGTWTDDYRPEVLQANYLSYLYDYLSEGGELWIGIENRLNPLYFIGRTHHGDIPFTPLMPRKMASLLTYAVKRTSYRTYTYSKQEYKKLLKQAGYKNVEIYYPFPDYKLPKFILSTDKDRLFCKWLAQVGLDPQTKRLDDKIGLKAFQLLDWLKLCGVFAPAYIIKATKSQICIE